MEARPAVLLICLTARSQASGAPLRLQIPPGTPTPQGSESTVRIRLSLISQPTGPGGKQSVPGAGLRALQQKDIILAASASPSACTIFCRCSCFAFSTRNWARWASCWAVAGENRGHRGKVSGTPSLLLLPQKPLPDSSRDSPTCLASTAAVYSRLKLSSVMATSSSMRLKSLALSVSSRRINKDTWWPGGGERGVEGTGELKGRRASVIVRIPDLRRTAESALTPS